MENTDGSELGDGPRGGEEELQDVNCLGCLGVGDIAHIANSLGGLKVDHLMLVTEPAIQHLHHWFAKTLVLFGQLGGQTYQQNQSSRALNHTRGAVLLHHLDQGHPVVGTHLIEETNRMVLGHEV